MYGSNYCVIYDLKTRLIEDTVTSPDFEWSILPGTGHPNDGPFKNRTIFVRFCYTRTFFV
jgi:hypothetical protein